MYGESRSSDGTVTAPRCPAVAAFSTLEERFEVQAVEALLEWAMAPLPRAPVGNHHYVDDGDDDDASTLHAPVRGTSPPPLGPSGGEEEA
eukprot:3683631-Rhodomonas_salina.2